MSGYGEIASSLKVVKILDFRRDGVLVFVSVYRSEFELLRVAGGNAPGSWHCWDTPRIVTPTALIFGV